MNVAQLTIEMAANVARLKTDMAAARNTVEGTMNSIKKSASLAATALGAIGVGLSVNAFAGWIKSAINAADETNKLAQKIGITVKEIGGLQLAFQQGGVDAGTMEKALAKLNVNIANGDAAFKTLGVSTKNTDGSLRSTTSVLIDIADKFASTQNGAAKTAMAMEMFGKSGAALIPVLNAGGDSIREFGELAQKLGLVLTDETAAAAEKFNDTLELIGLGSRGVANQVMAELLPTMQSLASEFFTLISEGDNLRNIAFYISTALKGLFTVVAGGVEIMRSLLIMTKATAQAFMALGSGDFAGIGKIFRETEKNLKDNWMKTLGSFDRLWNQTGNTAIEAAAKIVKGSVQSTKSMEDAEKAAKKLAEQQKKSLESAAALLEAIVFENKTLQMSNVEREIAINLRKLEATGLEKNTALYNAYAEAIRKATVDNEAIKERIKLEEEAAKKAQKIAEDYAKEMDQINNQIGQSLTDALVNGGRSAKEFLIDMFRTLILRPIIQPIITGMTGTVMAALGMGGSGNAMASSGGAAGAFNIMGSVKSAYDAVAGGFMSLGTQAAFAAEAMGSWLVTNTTGYLNSLGGSMMANSGAIGSFTSGAAGIGAGIMAGEFISGGRSVIGGNSLYTTGGGAAAGAALGTFVFPGVGTAIGGLVGGIVGGVINAAFGSGAKNVTGQFLQGTWTSEGIVDPRAFSAWEKKGGIFGGGGSGRDYRGISSDLGTFLNDAVKSVGDAAKGYADVLGLSKDALADVTHFFIIPANGYFDALGFTLYETSLAGADAANRLIEMVGGLDAFNQSMEFYYQNFYTQAERTAKATENLAKLFAEMNLQLPKSNQEFRALIQSAQAAGDDILLSNLLKLAPAFIEISNAAKEMANTAFSNLQKAVAREQKQVIKNLTDSYNELTKNLNNQLIAAKSANQIAKENYNSFKGIYDFLGDAINEIIGGVTKSAMGGMSFIDNALLNARTSGYLPSQEELSGAISDVRSGLGAENFATRFEMIRANANFANKLGELQLIAGDQMTVAEKQLNASNIQIELLTKRIEQAKIQYDENVARTEEHYEKILADAQAQIDALNGINTSVMSVEQAIQQLNSAILSVSVGAQVGTQFGAQAGNTMISSENAAWANTTGVEALYYSILGRAPDPEGLAFWNGALSGGASLSDIQQAFINSPEATGNPSSPTGLSAQGIQGFASGGYYTGGLAMVGENGPELINFSNPGMVYNSAQTGSMINSEMSQEIRGLREDNREQARAMVQLQTRMNRLLERWDGDGLPEERVVTA
jgi:hypothetical protein